MVSRTGYTGELGFELWCHPKDAPKVWDKVWECGKDLGITPMGLEGLDMVRIEAGLIFMVLNLMIKLIRLKQALVFLLH